LIILTAKTLRTQRTLRRRRTGSDGQVAICREESIVYSR
jgi:hypothetical protein